MHTSMPKVCSALRGTRIYQGLRDEKAIFMADGRVVRRGDGISCCSCQRGADYGRWGNVWNGIKSPDDDDLGEYGPRSRRYSHRHWPCRCDQLSDGLWRNLLAKRK